MRAMAVLIASDLHKDIAGKPLLRGVSFKLERRERMTIAGRNGAGKTTLLRMLAGEESIDRGELSLAEGRARGAARPAPAARARGGAARVRALGLRAGAGRGGASWRELERRWREARGGAAPTEATLDRYARAQARLEALGGYLWRDRATVMTRGLGLRARRTWSVRWTPSPAGS